MLGGWVGVWLVPRDWGIETDEGALSKQMTERPKLIIDLEMTN